MPGSKPIFSRRRTVLHFKDIHLSGSVPEIGRYNYSRARGGLETHAHEDVVEICYLARGRQMYRAGGKNYALGSNDVFVTQPNEQHSTGQYPEEKGILYWIWVNTNPKAGRFLTASQKDAAPLLKSLLGIKKRYFAGSPRLAALFDDVFAAYFRLPPSLRKLAVSASIVELLLEVIACTQREPVRDRSDDANQILEYIDSHLDEPLGVGELAEWMNLSVSWFKAKFRRQVGMPPAEYILRRKIARAEEMLVSGGFSVTDVAFRLGFASSQYFATVFKRYTYHRPTDFLQKPPK
ncbi:MAG: AraC family transcriptional regulator [Phycisphaerae bacterium]|nr:AraC family transcriptional regulator [Phycisphaerae bacterium]